MVFVEFLTIAFNVRLMYAGLSSLLEHEERGRTCFSLSESDFHASPSTLLRAACSCKDWAWGCLELYSLKNLKNGLGGIRGGFMSGVILTTRDYQARHGGPAVNASLFLGLGTVFLPSFVFDFLEAAVFCAAELFFFLAPSGSADLSLAYSTREVVVSERVTALGDSTETGLATFKRANRALLARRKLGAKRENMMTVVHSTRT